MGGDVSAAIDWWVRIGDANTNNSDIDEHDRLAAEQHNTKSE
jgi:hypothetical protein